MLLAIGRIPYIYLLVLLWFGMAGCGAVYTVQPLGSNERAGSNHIEYRLPKNLIEISIPITTRQHREGRLHSWAEACGIHRSSPLKPPESFGLPTFRLTVNPKDADRFLIDLSLLISPFSSRSLKMNLNDHAIPVSLSSTVEESSMDFYHEALLLPLRSAGIGTREHKPDCDLAKAVHCEHCPAAEAVRSEIKTIEGQWKTILANALRDPSGIQAATYELITRDLTKRREQLVAHFLGKTTESTRTVTIVVDPCKCHAKKCNWHLLTGADEIAKPKHLRALGANRFEFKSKPRNCDSADALCLVLRPEPLPSSRSKTRSNCSVQSGPDGTNSASPDTAGFHFRIPGAVWLKVTQGEGKSRKVLSTAHLPVAQYGRIAALPSRFGWMESSIEQLEFDPLTGAIRAVSINGAGLGWDDFERILNYDVMRDE